MSAQASRPFKIAYVGSPANFKEENNASKQLAGMLRSLAVNGADIYVGKPNEAIKDLDGLDVVTVLPQIDADVTMFNAVLITPGGPGAKAEAMKFCGNSKLYLFTNSGDAKGFGKPAWYPGGSDTDGLPVSAVERVYEIQSLNAEELVAQVLGKALKQDRDERGIPLKSDYPAGVSVPKFYLGLTSVMGSIGLSIGYAVYKLGSTAKYDAKIDTLSKNDLGWLYLCLPAIKLTQMVINTNLGIARKEAKVNVPDQQVYKVYTGNKPALGYVLMEGEGEIGTFNRAQRALQNYLEQITPFMTNLFAAGYVFPFPAFAISVLWGGARSASAIGYTKAPDGRVGGTLLSGILMNVLEGLVLLSAVKAIRK